MKNMKGNISIAKFMNSDIVQITIEDSLSGIEFVRLEMNAEEFARAIFGSSNRQCEFELVGIDKVGMEYEYKSVLIQCETLLRKGKDEDVSMAKELLKPFEVDGWAGRLSDMFNQNNHDKVDGVKVIKVHFGRYVKVEGGNDSEES